MLDEQNETGGGTKGLPCEFLIAGLINITGVTETRLYLAGESKSS